ncbi:MAG TPA: NAD(+) kinase [Gammaproteobacteria bacterium]|jgi:NAD+ kinase|nr:NAD(+) kinase [Gammaproteobacteria bacterium]
MTTAFSTVGLMGRESDPVVAQVAAKAVDFLSNARVKVLVDANLKLPLTAPGAKAVSRAELAAEADLIIVVGGDGTLLKAAHTIAARPVPLVGVNLGRLGFLTDITPEKLQDDISAILKGEFSREERLLLDSCVQRAGGMQGCTPALNDVVVQKFDGGRLIEFETHVDGHFVCAHRADGIVVATPTGSTAYALSGGGPILHPAQDAITLVPICPHTLGDRPIVVAGGSTIEIVLTHSHGGKAQVTWDGQRAEPLTVGERVQVKRAQRRIVFIHPRGYDYYKILRTKLHWGRTKHGSGENQH